MTFVLTLSGCAALDLKRPINDDDKAKLKKVGVISLLGDTFHGSSVGTTVFNNTYFTAQVPEWDVDGFAATHALAILRENDRFQSDLISHPNLRAEQLSANKSQLVWELAERQGFDTVVSIWPSVSENYPWFQPGYGFLERSFLGMSKRCEYAGYVVEAYNVASRKRIAWEWGGDMPCRMGSEQQLPFKEKFEDYSDDDKRVMRGGLEDRIAETLRYALGKLALVPQ
jgi:hypothetical protein